VDKNGQLNVFSAVGSGKWKGSQTIGPAGLADSGATLAVSQHFGIDDQTDVFVIDKKELLNVFSVHSRCQWSDPVTLSPQGSAPSGAQLAVSQQFGVTYQTDVFFFGQTGSQAGRNGQSWPAMCWANDANPWNGSKELVNDL
jgi:hypothetical protein